MSFPILLAGWWLVAFALSWPLHVYSLSAYAPHAEGEKIDDFGPFGATSVRLIWSFAFALGATLISTAGLGWSP